MAIDRPTFNESWHRVANMKPRLRSFVQVQRQHYRGRLWFVLRDPSNNRFFRLDESAHHFIGLLDGKRTVARAWELANEHLGDRAPTQGEAIQLLGQLYTSNLLQAELPPDAGGMFERYRKRVRREVGGYMMNLLFARIPIFDPDRMLERWLPAAGWVFSPIGFVLWTVLIGCGLWALAGRADELFDQAAVTLNPSNLIWLYACFAGIKALHELGHAFACKRFGLRERTGGEVHTIGIMLLVLMPVPYVDASSAWALRSKWRRIIVSAAGMYVELAVAAVAAIVWARTGAGTATHAIAFNLIFIASVSTILFNGNPLIRFDGYYILSDLLEAPNLNQRSKEYLYYLVKKFIYGVRKPRDPSHGRRERAWLLTYAVASTIYRVFIGVVIVLFVADQLFFVGMLLAFGAVIGWVLVPIGKFIKYLATSPELMRVRPRAALSTFVFVAAVLAGLGMIPVPDRSRAEGVVEPRAISTVYAATDGFVVRSRLTGAAVAPGGAPLIEARNVELETQLERLRADRRLLEARYRQARADEIAGTQVMRHHLASLDDQIVRVRRQIADLKLDPPQAGQWIAFDIDRTQGAFVQRGDPVGVVATLDDAIIRVTADQYLGPRLGHDIAAGEPVQIKVRRRPDLHYEGRIEKVLPAGRRELPTAALGLHAGGALDVKPDARRGTEAAEPFFEIIVRPEPGSGDAAALLPGQRVVVRFELPPKPLLEQGWRAARQLVQRRLRI